jgi:hypothetical protein
MPSSTADLTNGPVCGGIIFFRTVLSHSLEYCMVLLPFIKAKANAVKKEWAGIGSPPALNSLRTWLES